MTNNLRSLEMRARIFKALGHPSRLQMVESLFEGERCVCELQELVGSNMSTVSKHLNVLKEAGIVQLERRGTNIYYSLRMKCVSTFLSCVEQFFGEHLEEQIKILKGMKKVSAR